MTDFADLAPDNDPDDPVWSRRGLPQCGSGRRRMDVDDEGVAGTLDQLERLRSVLAFLRPQGNQIRVALATQAGRALGAKVLDDLDHLGALLRTAQKSAVAKYGLTRDDYWHLVTRQGSACAICRRPFTTGVKPHIDHNHATGEVRGVLCHRCNTGLGQLFDSPAVVAHALAYLTDRGHYGPADLEDLA